MGTAQLVEYQTERPGALLMQVQVHGVARFFSPESTFSADSSLTVSIQPLCAIAYINICARIKNPKQWQPHHCLDTEILHTLIGMGSAALVVVVPLPK